MFMKTIDMKTPNPIMRDQMLPINIEKIYI